MHKYPPKNSIPIHLAVCNWCGEPIGVIMGRRFGIPLRHEDGTPIEEHERIATNDLCNSCKKKKAATEQEVAKGGVFFKCSNCGAEGAVKAEHPLAKAVRKQLDIAAPNPCGVEFDKGNCPVCTEQIETP